jgi:hypothetical protein
MSPEDDNGQEQTDTETAASRGRAGMQRVVAAVTSTRAKGVYVSVMVLAVAVGALYMSYQLWGLVDTLVYAVAFIGAATVLPLSILLLRAGMPFNSAVGRFHIVLGAFAFNYHYLVQLDDRWEWCPGREDAYYLDGEWYDIDGGYENRSVLGWRPFGILRHKEHDTLADQRVDDAGGAEIRSVADGGAVSQGGYQMDASVPDTDDGEWVLDLRRVVTRGIKRIGDIELIETTEEVTERGQVDEAKMGSYRPAVTYVVTLIIGLVVGYLLLFAGA